MSIPNTTLCELAEAYGTPLYVYSRRTIVERFSALQTALASIRPLICFAMKANATLEILRTFHGQGAGFDIVSEGELRRVLKIDGDPSKVVFSGVGKTRDEIEFALQSRIKFFNVESLAELDCLESVARSLNVKAPYCVRINPDVDAQTHKHLTTGTKASKFGIAVTDAIEAVRARRDSAHLQFQGLDCHIGSQITDVAPLEEAYREVMRLAALFTSQGLAVRCLDLGGGFGISYSGHYASLDMNKLSTMVARVFGGCAYEFAVEPGRFLIAEAGSLLTRVLYLKDNQGRKFAVVDAGMNDMVRPAMYDAYHQIDIVSPRSSSAVVASGVETVDVVGPVCESACYFARNRQMTPIQTGDLLAIRDTGAYGAVMASNYNARRMPAEILVEEDGTSEVIRRRDVYEDLWRNET